MLVCRFIIECLLLSDEIFGTLLNKVFLATVLDLNYSEALFLELFSFPRIGYYAVVLWFILLTSLPIQSYNEFGFFLNITRMKTVPSNLCKNFTRTKIKAENRKNRICFRDKQFCGSKTYLKLCFKSIIF